MNRLVIYSLGAVLLLGTFAGASVMGQMYGSGTGGSIQKASPEQLKECAALDIPEFSCTETTILAKRRIGIAAQGDAYGSGTPMLSQAFGEMGVLIAVLAVIFGAVAVVFFVKARGTKKQVQ